MSSELPFSELDNSSGAYNFGRELANAARGVTCGLWRDYAGAFLGAPLAVGEPIRQFNEGFWNTVCPPDNYPHPPDPPNSFSGGQCAVQYTITSSATLRDRNDPSFTNPLTDTRQLTGPILGMVANPSGVSNGQSYGISFVNGSGAVDFAGVFGTGGSFYIANAKIDSVVRVDGQPDNCGDPPHYPDPTPPPDSRRRNVPIPVPLPNGSLITVVINEIEINNTFNTPVNVKMNNRFNLQFDLGGVKFDFPNNTIGSGATDLTPVLNATTQIQRDLVDVAGTTQDIYDKRLRFIDNNVSIASCSDGNVIETPVTIKVLSDGVNSETVLTDYLFAELYNLRREGQITCLPAENATVLFEGSTVPGQGVLYSDILQPPSIGYLLEITSFDINMLRTYTLYGEDSEYGFGNVSLTSSNKAVIGDYARVFTTRTFLPAENIKFPHRVRVSLKRGIEFRVVDLGYNPG